MRVLQVVPSLIKGGAERLVLDISQQLAAMGHEVKVVVLRDDNRYPELSGKCAVQLARSSVYYSLFGVDQIDIDAYERVVDEFNPDVIQSHLLDAEFVTRHAPRKRIAYLTHWHGCPEVINPIPFRQWFTKDAVWKWNMKRRLMANYRGCNNHFLCISEFISEYVEQNLDARKEDISVIHNAIDTSLFRPQGGAKPSEFRLISIGSLQKNKNHIFQFRAMRRLIDLGHTDIHLDVYGEGPELISLQRSINELGLAHHVTMHGIVHNIPDRINASHLLVHSAWHEPFGLILIEAMACGIPVISFDTGGPAELVIEGENGFLVKKDDLEAYANKIIWCNANRDQLEQMGKRGTDFAQKFGLAEYAKKLELLYKDLVKKKAH